MAGFAAVVAVGGLGCAQLDGVGVEGNALALYQRGLGLDAAGLWVGLQGDGAAALDGGRLYGLCVALALALAACGAQADAQAAGEAGVAGVVCALACLGGVVEPAHGCCGAQGGGAGAFGLAGCTQVLGGFEGFADDAAAAKADAQGSAAAAGLVGLFAAVCAGLQLDVLGLDADVAGGVQVAAVLGVGAPGFKAEGAAECAEGGALGFGVAGLAGLLGLLAANGQAQPAAP